jgi:hypothetical protein
MRVSEEYKRNGGMIMPTDKVQVEESINTLSAVLLFRTHYGSNADGLRLCREATKVLRGGGLLSDNIATAIESYLENKIVIAGGPPGEGFTIGTSAIGGPDKIG